MVPSLAELENYPWSSHATIMGKCKSDWLDADFVLSLFDSKLSTAQRKYQKFIAESLGPDYLFNDLGRDGCPGDPL